MYGWNEAFKCFEGSKGKQTSKSKTILRGFIRPGKIDSQFIVTAHITPNTTASTFIMLEFIQFLTDFQIFTKFLMAFIKFVLKMKNEKWPPARMVFLKSLDDKL